MSVSRVTDADMSESAANASKKISESEQDHLNTLISEVLEQEGTPEQLDEMFQGAEDIATWSFWPLDNTRRPQW